MYYLILSIFTSSCPNGSRNKTFGNNILNTKSKPKSKSFRSKSKLRNKFEDNGINDYRLYFDTNFDEKNCQDLFDFLDNNPAKINISDIFGENKLFDGHNMFSNKNLEKLKTLSDAFHDKNKLELPNLNQTKLDCLLEIKKLNLNNEIPEYYLSYNKEQLDKIIKLKQKTGLTEEEKQNIDTLFELKPPMNKLDLDNLAQSKINSLIEIKDMNRDNKIPPFYLSFKEESLKKTIHFKNKGKNQDEKDIIDNLFDYQNCYYLTNINKLNEDLNLLSIKTLVKTLRGMESINKVNTSIYNYDNNDLANFFNCFKTIDSQNIDFIHRLLKRLCTKEHLYRYTKNKSTLLKLLNLYQKHDSIIFHEIICNLSPADNEQALDQIIKIYNEKKYNKFKFLGNISTYHTNFNIYNIDYINALKENMNIILSFTNKEIQENLFKCLKFMEDFETVAEYIKKIEEKNIKVTNYTPLSTSIENAFIPELRNIITALKNALDGK